MKLHCQVYPQNLDLNELSPGIPLVIIPGLFGSTTNWNRFASHYRLLNEAESTAKANPVVILDQRNHGRSPHASSNSYADMVADLLEFCDQHGLHKINLCGHSMGGKVAMLFSLEYPRHVHKLIVLDIAPITYQHNHAQLLESLMAVDLLSLKSRSEADKRLQSAIPDTATRLFLLQSLSGSPGAYQWRLNLPILHRHVEEIGSFPEIEKKANSRSLFISGSQSNYLLEEHHVKILTLFPHALFKSISGAGHWLHVEKPQRVIEAMREFLEI